MKLADIHISFLVLLGEGMGSLVSEEFFCFVDLKSKFPLLRAKMGRVDLPGSIYSVWYKG